MQHLTDKERIQAAQEAEQQRQYEEEQSHIRNTEGAVGQNLSSGLGMRGALYGSLTTEAISLESFGSKVQSFITFFTGTFSDIANNSLFQEKHLGLNVTRRQWGLIKLLLMFAAAGSIPLLALAGIDIIAVGGNLLELASYEVLSVSGDTPLEWMLSLFQFIGSNMPNIITLIAAWNMTPKDLTWADKIPVIIHNEKKEQKAIKAMLSIKSYIVDTLLKKRIEPTENDIILIQERLKLLDTFGIGDFTKQERAALRLTYNYISSKENILSHYKNRLKDNNSEFGINSNILPIEAKKWFNSIKSTKELEQALTNAYKQIPFLDINAQNAIRYEIDALSKITTAQEYKNWVSNICNQNNIITSRSGKTMYKYAALMSLIPIETINQLNNQAFKDKIEDLFDNKHTRQHVQLAAISDFNIWHHMFLINDKPAEKGQLRSLSGGESQGHNIKSDLSSLEHEIVHSLLHENDVIREVEKPNRESSKINQSINTLMWQLNDLLEQSFVNEFGQSAKNFSDTGDLNSLNLDLTQEEQAIISDLLTNENIDILLNNNIKIKNKLPRIQGNIARLLFLLQYNDYRSALLKKLEPQNARNLEAKLLTVQNYINKNKNLIKAYNEFVTHPQMDYEHKKWLEERIVRYGKTLNALKKAIGPQGVNELENAGGFAFKNIIFNKIEKRALASANKGAYWKLNDIRQGKGIKQNNTDYAILAERNPLIRPDLTTKQELNHQIIQEALQNIWQKNPPVSKLDPAMPQIISPDIVAKAQDTKKDININTSKEQGKVSLR